MRWAISSHEACHAHISKLLPRSLCLCLSASLFTSLPLCLSLSLGASLTFSVSGHRLSLHLARRCCRRAEDYSMLLAQCLLARMLVIGSIAQIKGGRGGRRWRQTDVQAGAYEAQFDS